MIRLIKTAAAIGLSLALASAAQATAVAWPGPVSPPPALSLPADLGARPSDGAIMQLTYEACRGQASCTSRAWANPYVQSCRNSAPQDAACFGLVGAVRVALHGVQSAPAVETPQCAAWLVPARGANGAWFCVSPGTVVD